MSAGLNAENLSDADLEAAAASAAFYGLRAAAEAPAAAAAAADAADAAAVSGMAQAEDGKASSLLRPTSQRAAPSDFAAGIRP